jgi:hypothetical protein
MLASGILARRRLWPLLAGFLLTGVGCIIAGDKCDAHQIELHGSHALCVCEANAVMDPNGYGCTPCGENEEVQNGTCACKEGFAKTAEGGSCSKSDIGASCSPEGACVAPYPYCAKIGSADGYCTSDNCSSNDDCPAQWTCEQASGTRFCQKARTGLGAACDSSADCAGFNAKYCDTLQSHSCQLADCATGGGACPNAWGCCDYSALLGSPLSLCLAPMNLSAGSCPSGGRLAAP